MSEESRSCRVIQGVCQRDGGAWAVDNEMRDVINRLYGNKNIVKLNNVVDKYYRRKKILCFGNTAFMQKRPRTACASMLTFRQESGSLHKCTYNRTL